MAKGTFALEWVAHEYEHKERSQDWFWATGIITAGAALAFIIFGDVIFGILILVAAAALALFINRPPEDVSITISEQGVRRGNVLYPFDTLAGFWIDTEHPHKKVLIRSKKALMPLIIVPLSEEVSLDALRAELGKRIQEEYHSLPLAERILEYLGF